MAGHAARYEVLLAGRQVGDSFRGGGGIGPGPGGEFVDEVVAREDELFGRDLACVAEGGGVGDGGPAVAEGVEGGVYDVHADAGECGCCVAVDGDEVGGKRR